MRFGGGHLIAAKIQPIVSGRQPDRPLEGAPRCARRNEVERRLERSVESHAVKRLSAEERRQSKKNAGVPCRPVVGRQMQPIEIYLVSVVVVVRVCFSAVAGPSVVVTVVFRTTTLSAINRLPSRV